jgi:hypothetical protein
LRGKKQQHYKLRVVTVHFTTDEAMSATTIKRNAAANAAASAAAALSQRPSTRIYEEFGFAFLCLLSVCLFNVYLVSE